MRVKRYQFNRKTFISIVDEYDCPVDPYVSNYINAELIGKSSNTAKRYVEELLFLLKFCDSESIDLIVRVSSGVFISAYEYKKFYESSFVQQKINTKQVKHIALFSTENKNFRNIISARIHKESLVSTETIRGRLRRLRKFLKWLYIEIHAGNTIPNQVGTIYHKIITKISNDENSLLRRGNQNTSSFDESVIPDEIFEQLQKIIKPNSKDNPFTSSKLRNYLIVLIIIETGIRRGSLAKLKISDCQFHGKCDSISVYRLQDDRNDPRINRPSHKTRAHIATINPKTMELIKLYIDTVRQSLSRSVIHDFVFVSEKDSKHTAGLPISLSTINSIFNKLSGGILFF